MQTSDPCPNCGGVPSCLQHSLRLGVNDFDGHHRIELTCERRAKELALARLTRLEQVMCGQHGGVDAWGLIKKINEVLYGD